MIEGNIIVNLHKHLFLNQSPHIYCFLFNWLQDINHWLELTDIKQEVQNIATKRMTNIQINYSSQSTNKCNLYYQQQRTCIIPVLINTWVFLIVAFGVWAVFKLLGGSYSSRIGVFHTQFIFRVFCQLT